MDEARATLGLIDEYTVALQQEAERLAAVRVTDEQIEAMLDCMYPVAPTDTDIRKRRIINLKDNFFACLQAPDLKQFKGTAYAVAMAATDFADHGEPMRKTQNFESNRFYSILQGHPFVDGIYKQLAA